MNNLRVEPIKLISRICKCCGVTYSRRLSEEDYGVCDRCLSKTLECGNKKSENLI